MDKIRVEHRERITIVSIARPEVRNAVDGDTARRLAAAFAAFDANPESDVAVLNGDYGNFCAGADLNAIADDSGGNPLSPEGDGPMGPSRMVLGKPLDDALRNEFERGLAVIASRETLEGATRFASGKGRHGDFDEI